MAIIKVKSQNLRSKAEELRGLNSKFKNQVSNLQTQQKSLTAMWDGQANVEFDKAFNRDIVQMNNFHTLIEQYVHALEQICAEYEKAENKNIKTAQNRTY